MQKALSILEQIAVHLPEIKRTLGKNWPGFAGQMRALAASFENLVDQAALDAAADQLMLLFVVDDQIVDVMTRPVSAEMKQIPLLSNLRHYLDRHEPARVIPLKTVANRFILLCREPDKAAEPDQADAEGLDNVSEKEKK